ncbi:MAG TPA: ABC transporter substrate-binding protein [Thermomicrobiales bacterium]|jgi:peptide/nickel transport system substrate-binding protein
MGSTPEQEISDRDFEALRHSLLSRRRLLQYGATGAGALAARPFARVSSAAAAMQDEQPQPGGRLKVIYTNDPDVLDPHLTSSIAAIRVIDLVYETLLGFDENQQLIPVLAESWEVPDDTTYVFHLRQGVTFHNGRPLVADDVKYSYERIMDPKTGSPQTWYFSAVDTIETPDQATVKITMKTPFAPFLNALAQPQPGSIVPKEEVEKQGGTLNQQAVGTGPFILKEWVPTTKVTYDRNPNYWMAGKPYLDGIDVTIQGDEAVISTAIRAKSTDFVDYVPPKDFDNLKSMDDLTLIEFTGTDWEYLGFNTQKKPFDDKRVRQAIAWTVNVDDVVQKAYFGHATKLTCGPLPDWSWAHCTDTAYPAPDLEKAKALLQEAGYADGFKMTITMGRPAATYNAAAEITKAALKQIGIDAEIDGMEWGTWVDKVINQKDFESTITGWHSFIDPDQYLYPEFHTGEFWNWYSYSNPQVDQLLEQGRTTLDQEQRKTIYVQLQQLLADEAVYVFYTNDNVLKGHFNNVKGYQAVPSASNIFFRETWLAK